MELLTIRMKLPKNEYNIPVTSIMPEIDEKIGRASVLLEEDDDNFYIYIRAPDTASIKPAISSINRLLLLAYKIKSEVM